MTDERILEIAKSLGLTFNKAWGICEQGVGNMTFIHFARAIAAEQREEDAKVCEKSDRYRGEYFASVIRKGGEK